MAFYKPRITVCGIEYLIDATHSGSVFHVLEHYVNSILSFRTKNGQSCVLNQGVTRREIRLKATKHQNVSLLFQPQINDFEIA